MCGFCMGAPGYKWKKNFRSKDIQEKLSANRFNLGLIEEIAVLQRTESGRVKYLRIKPRNGRPVTISAARFRKIIGPNVVKSNLYDIVMEGYYFNLTGRGWGHGVGMCQWGAYQMSRQRHKYTSILEYYYPGAEIAEVSEL